MIFQMEQSKFDFKIFLKILFVQGIELKSDVFLEKQNSRLVYDYYKE